MHRDKEIPEVLIGGEVMGTETIVLPDFLHSSSKKV